MISLNYLINVVCHKPFNKGAKWNTRNICPICGGNIKKPIKGGLVKYD